MDLEALVRDADVRRALTALRRKVQRGNVTYSDIVDDEGNQYVDLVMEGGGMLGIALVGYTWALEQMGIRFLGVGGTSAGSINALLLAGLDVPANPKSPKVLHELTTMNFFDFVDGDGDSRDLIKAYINGAGKIKLGFKAMQVIDTLTRDLGLNPGRVFERWLRTILAREGVRTLADLDARMNTIPKGLRTRQGELLNTPKKAGARLAIVAADVSTETKVIFPDMANLYFREPKKVNPARFARASMSIPYFFEPLILRNLPRGPAARRRWMDVGFDPDTEQGGLPKRAVFVDGGIMSNFPIDAFHQASGVPAAPTFGVKLQYDNRSREIDGPMNLLGAIFNSARHCLDYDFIRRNPDFKELVQWIPAQEYNWLDFNMSDEHKAGLFREGALKAVEFLRGFDWPAYKETRRKLGTA